MAAMLENGGQIEILCGPRFFCLKGDPYLCQKCCLYHNLNDSYSYIICYVGIANKRRWGKHSRHSRRMHNPQFYVSGKRLIYWPGKRSISKPHQYIGWHFQYPRRRLIIRFQKLKRRHICKQNKRVLQTLVPLPVHRKSAGVKNRPLNVLYAFERKPPYIIIHAPHTRAVAFWHITNIHPTDFIVKFVIVPPYFIKKTYLWNIATPLVVGCFVYKVMHVVWAAHHWGLK